MEQKKVYLIYRPSPTLGRSVSMGGNGSSFIDLILNGNTVDHYLSALQKEVDSKNLNWHIYRDDTESDIDKLVTQNAKLLICIPGLKYQFNNVGFDKHNIIYLSTMEYANNETARIINRIIELDTSY